MRAELIQKGGLASQVGGVQSTEKGPVADVATVAVADPQVAHEVEGKGWQDVIRSLPLLIEDLQFIEKQMKQVVSFPKRVQIAIQYRRHWEQAAEQQPISYRKENSGRFSANSYIRNEIQNVATIH
ncbi:MAG: hypothetical protein CL388_06785 [Acidiferrobacteraceae bacterium]|nr:hypothetical protein [Acidiferrobacteraceae bacterium]